MNHLTGERELRRYISLGWKATYPPTSLHPLIGLTLNNERPSQRHLEPPPNVVARPDAAALKISDALFNH